MAFDWIRFLNSYGIPYVESGPNVARDNIGIRCPFCGTGDSGEHMGLSLKGKGWGCWRDARHRGGRPAKLVQRLLGCAWEEALRITGDDESVLISPDATFGDDIDKLLGAGKPVDAPAPQPLHYTRDIKPLEDSGMGRTFITYLQHERGYGRSEAVYLARRYDLRYATKGPFAYRLIVPVYMPRMGLANWTGRSIMPRAFIRYRTLSANPEKAAEDNLPPARLSVEKTLWNYKELEAAPRGKFKTLAVHEGPMDALRVDWLGEPNGIRATCLFGTGNLSEEQIALLALIAPKFRRRVLMLDKDASLLAFRMWSRLEAAGFETRDVPKGFKDPAEFDRVMVLKLFL